MCSFPFTFLSRGFVGSDGIIDKQDIPCGEQYCRAGTIVWALGQVVQGVEGRAGLRVYSDSRGSYLKPMPSLPPSPTYTQKNNIKRGQDAYVRWGDLGGGRLFPKLGNFASGVFVP